MPKKLLIDASYPEETRVAVISGNLVEEFDYESAACKPLKGNVYLAKVVRVEASLQAAFVDYGGNRHGFLPFNDIHPDYYKIPIADREALLAEEAERARQAEEDEDSDNQADPSLDVLEENSGPAEESPEDPLASNGEDAVADDDDDNGGSEANLTADDSAATQEAATRRSDASFFRRYRIQEVIKRNQIMLVQIVKEERGNKGAALTTRLSLAGRYCVLMPNTSRGGGVSRKISNVSDRRKIRTIMDSLDIPPGMAVIVRTAGQNRTKVEIRRDYEYLMRIWSEIRERTLNSTAPCLINEEGDLIKRSIRDLYNREMDEVLVNDDSAYRMAKSTMRMLMPSHAKRVKHYKDDAVPLFRKHMVEQQLDSIFTPRVELKSGGYIIINQTEALVSIDVNSGRATRERSIEETAFKTNVEAAEEIARQLRLRDLAGLIVIDFIDMDDRRNQSRTESRLKDALKVDRARIQVGRISMFGLLEMSRQRLRPSLAEISTTVCPSCKGAGVIQSIDSLALQVLRALEDRAVTAGGGVVAAFLPEALAPYILNEKRSRITELEQRYDVRIMVWSDTALTAPDFRIQVNMQEEPSQAREKSDSKDRSSSRRRSGRRPAAETASAKEETTDEPSSESRPDEEDDDKQPEPRRLRRRGKRGGRRRRRRGQSEESGITATSETESPANVDDAGVPASPDENSDAGLPEDAPGDSGDARVDAEENRPRRATRPRRRRSRSRPKSDGAADAEASENTAAPANSGRPVESPPAEPVVSEVFTQTQTETNAPSPSSAEDSSSPKQKRQGWWQKLTG